MIIYEAAVSIPIIAMLAMTAMAVFLWGIKTYFMQIADGELEQEVEIAFQELLEDSMSAVRIEKMPGKQGYEIVKKNNPLKPQKPDKETFSVTYCLNEVDGVVKLVCGGVRAPLTGNHALAPVDITDFAINEDEHQPGVYHLRLTGKSGVTKHEYSLCSAVFVPAP
ncbi:hypothetical protein [Selenomonas ruminantium]|uniref:Pilus assembly protein n=1 Tax=Selenomonas ruminantium TaxID=971 RepID=A0A1H0T4V1_SELRU|nr:hypothetical protein [Selenomonas ruminantium]SDP48841.1 hypothetical protein SAMN05216366_12137 [Selenomonas ruminantium]